MRSRISLLTAVTAAAILAGAVATSAATFTVTEETYSAAWRSLVFEGGSELNVTCAVTLAGSFNEGTFPATAGTSIGTVNRASVSGCSGGAARALTETLPWTVQYSSFGGTLPAITSISLKVIEAGFKIRLGGFIECLGRTSTRSPLAAIGARETAGAITSLRADESAGIPLTGSLCPAEGRVRGTGTFTGEAEPAKPKARKSWSRWTAPAPASSKKTEAR